MMKSRKGKGIRRIGGRLGHKPKHRARVAPVAALYESQIIVEEVEEEELSLSWRSATCPAVLSRADVRADMLVELSKEGAANKFHSVSVIGGKALKLWEQIQSSPQGCTVPRAAAVTTYAYIEFMSELLPADPANIRARIQEAALPEALTQAVARFIGSLPAGVSVAVRSSSTLEDMDGSSFAGMYETILNVPASDIEAVSAAIKKCWASAWDPRVTSYKTEQNVGVDELPVVAVVIQQQINSEASGVIFSVNPMRSDRQETVVEAIWGQGEGLVGGLISPHTYTVSFRGEILQKSDPQQDKKFAFSRESHGIEFVETSNAERNSSPLTEEQVKRLAELSHDVSKFYGCPYDLEWARVGDTIYLLQARPITSLNIPVSEWWMYLGFNASCLLTLSMSSHAWVSMMNKYIGVDDGPEIIRFFFNHPFVKYSIEKRYSELSKPDLTDLTQTIEADVTSLEKRFACRAGEALSEALSLQDEFNTSSFVVGEAAREAESQLSKCVPTTIVAGLVDGVNADSEVAFSSELIKSLADLFASHLQSKSVEFPISLEDMTDFCQGTQLMSFFNSFVARFAYMSSRDEDLQVVRWGEDPTIPFSILCNLVSSAIQDESLAVDQNTFSSEIKTEQKNIISLETDTYKEALAGIDDNLIPLVNNLRKLLELKERVHVLYTRHAVDIRRLLKEKAISIPDVDFEDLFAVDYATLKTLWSRSPSEIASIIRGYKVEYEMFKSFEIPSWIQGKVSIDPSTKKKLAKLKSVKKITGLGCSAGETVGAARVINSLDEAHLVKKGEVLVTRYTDPSWTPMFSLVNAVVIAEGGLLSHAAVVSREVGVPCVVQAKGCLHIPNGATVKVDGLQGTIEVLE